MNFNILVPGGELIYNTVSGWVREFLGQLHLSGDHTVQIYCLGVAQRAG